MASAYFTIIIPAASKTACQTRCNELFEMDNFQFIRALRPIGGTTITHYAGFPLLNDDQQVELSQLALEFAGFDSVLYRIYPRTIVLNPVDWLAGKGLEFAD